MSNEWQWAENPQDSRTNLGFPSAKTLRPGISPVFLVRETVYVVLMQVTGRRKGCCIFSDESPNSIDWLWVLQPSWALGFCFVTLHWMLL